MSTAVVSSPAVSPATVATLRNGLRVANFSSPHAFNFTDGTVIPRVAPDRVKFMELDVVERVVAEHDRWVDIELEWRLPERIKTELDILQDDPGVDIILVPLPVMVCIRKERDRLYGEEAQARVSFVDRLLGNVPDPKTGEKLWSKARVLRNADRETKEIHVDKFCV